MVKGLDAKRVGLRLAKSLEVGFVDRESALKRMAPWASGLRDV